MLLTKKRLYKIKNSYNQTKKRKKRGGGRRRRKRRRRSFSNKRKPLNLRKSSLKRYKKKGGNHNGNYYWIIITPGTDKKTTLKIHLLKINDLYLADRTSGRGEESGFTSFLTKLYTKQDLEKNIFYTMVIVKQFNMLMKGKKGKN